MHCPEESFSKRKERARRILRILRRAYPEEGTALQYRKAWQLLIAVILSAQTTDAQVNRVTPLLFKKYPSLEALSRARLDVLERILHPTGYYKSKARRIRDAARYLLKEYQGEVPLRMKDLVRIPGVGRKTANVILHELNQPPEGIVVDTHIYRVSKRLCLSTANTPEGVEEDLMRLYPKKDWKAVGEAFIRHGRSVCHARKPACEACPVRELCPNRREGEA